MATVALGTKAVGSKVQLKLGGVKKNFIIVHKGKPSSLYDDSCNGVWLLQEDIQETRQWQSTNVNKLESSEIQAYLNSTYLALFDANIQAQIKQVKIPYRQNGGSGGTDRSGANGLSCKIFLLSAREVGFSDTYIPNDGAKLDYFNSGNGTDTKRVAKYNGSATLSFALDEDGRWIWADGPDFPLDDGTVTSILEALASLKFQQVLPAGEDKSEYGLDTPSATLTAAAGTGEQSLAFGKTTTDGDSYYMCMNGDESTVYIVADTLMKLMRTPIYDMCALPELLRAVGDWRLVMYGLAVIIIMIVRPRGLMGGKEITDLKIFRALFTAKKKPTLPAEDGGGADS